MVQDQAGVDHQLQGRLLAPVLEPLIANRRSCVSRGCPRDRYGRRDEGPVVPLARVGDELDPASSTKNLVLVTARKDSGSLSLDGHSQEDKADGEEGTRWAPCVHNGADARWLRPSGVQNVGDRPQQPRAEECHAFAAGFGAFRTRLTRRCRHGTYRGAGVRQG
jgi:hypothetical protein